MEIIILVISLFLIIGFFVIVETIKKIRTKQDHMYKLMKEQNDLLSEQLTIMKGNYKPSGEQVTLTPNNRTVKDENS